jgi:hypothetical protein
MNLCNRSLAFAFCAAAALVPALALPAAAQNRPEARPAAASAPSEQDVADTQVQFLKLLRLSPVLTTVVARDPSLLADQAYVARNNPELAQFMASHPDIAKNPEFYLFSRLDQRGGNREQALERAVWPDLVQSAPYQMSPTAEVMDKLIPIIVLPTLFLAVAWLIRLFVDSRRWTRTFKQQSEVHARLIDKLGTSQDLAAYMETEAGKRFLMAAPVPLGSEPVQRMPNAVARVLTPMQIGAVMTLLGIGLYFLRHAGPDMETPMTVLGTLALMPGIGFILSAAATWVLAHRLGLMPDKPAAQIEAAPPFSPQDRQ